MRKCVDGEPWSLDLSGDIGTLFMYSWLIDSSCCRGLRKNANIFGPAQHSTITLGLLWDLHQRFLQDSGSLFKPGTLTVLHRGGFFLCTAQKMAAVKCSGDYSQERRRRRRRRKGLTMVKPFVEYSTRQRCEVKSKRVISQWGQEEHTDINTSASGGVEVAFFLCSFSSLQHKFWTVAQKNVHLLWCCKNISL